MILGCKEIPIVVNDENSTLPILDTTRLLAGYAIRLAMSDVALPAMGSWIACKEGWLR